jgi:beta-galactosidase
MNTPALELAPQAPIPESGACTGEGHGYARIVLWNYLNRTGPTMNHESPLLRQWILLMAAAVAILSQHRCFTGTEAAAQTPGSEPPVALPVLAPIPATVRGVVAPTARLDGAWRFSSAPPKGFERAGFDDATWTAIDVPGEWVMQGFAVVPGTAAGYRRRFTAPADWGGKQIKLRFDAVYSDATVWINGRAAGSHLGGFTAWELDVTDLVRPGGENVIALAVKSESITDVLATGSEYAAHPLGGITRKVTLFAVPEVNIRSFHVVTMFDKEYRDATLRLELTFANQGKQSLGLLEAAMWLKLTGPDGKPVALEWNAFLLPAIEAGQTLSHTLTIPVAAPAKWDCEHPNLYTIQSELVVSSVSSLPIETVVRRFGFRQVQVRGNQLFVNGRPVKLRGVCRHEVHPLRGRSLTPELSRKDVELFRAANINYIRTSHYPPAEEFVEACDELGMFVEEESPLCWIGHPSNPASDAWNLTEPKCLSAIVRPTLEMIERDRSHPSVIIWSLANESAWKPHFVVSRRQAAKADPTRPLSFHDQCWGKFNNHGSDTTIGNYHYPGPDGPARVADGTRPVLFGEYCHVNTYNRQETATDPGVRDHWGRTFAAMWEKMLGSQGNLGGAIWAGIDDVFFPSAGPPIGYGEWGIIDGWRRPKPEYWHVKKVYSPVRILDERLAVPPRGEPLRLRVANRHDFTNLAESRIEWSLGGESGTATADVPPRSEGTIEIRPKDVHLAGRRLSLKICSPRGFTIDEYRLPVGTVEPPKPRPAPTRSRLKLASDNETVSVHGDGFDWVFDRRAGTIHCGQRAGQTIVTGGPTLMLLPLRNGRSGKIHGEAIHPLNDMCTHWRATSVQTTKNRDGVEVRVAGQYDQARGTFVMWIDAAGRLTIGYRFTCLRAVEPRQTGIVFEVPPSFDTLRWRRNALWSVYPDDHIGRAVGRARAFPLTAPQKQTKNVCTEPTQPWALDANALGTNDFRATRENIRFVSLTDSRGRGLRVESDGRQSSRAWVDGDHIRLLVASFSTGGAEGFLANQLASERKPLRVGSAVEDTVQIVLLDSTPQ